MVNAEESVVIAVNGEIYNFVELRSVLSSKYRFASSSDSEVILHGYSEWGIRGLLERIDGMFAFSVYDRRARRLFLARDRVGIKPLHYVARHGAVVWASELKAIVSHAGGIALSVDYEALYDFLTYSYVPSPKTMYREVMKLEPAHYLEIDTDEHQLTKQCYWRLPTAQVSITLDAAIERTRSVVGRAVQEQLVSDVPVGCFLSGGIDSSIVVAEAAQRSPQLHTYSIGFDVAEHDETRFAGLVARAFHTEHEIELLGEDAAVGLFGRLRDWFDEPFADTSALPTYLVSRFGRSRCTVVLTGDGGDEVFGGYKWYRKYGDGAAPLGSLRSSTSAVQKWIRGTRASVLLGKFERRFVLDGLELYASLMGGLLREEKGFYRDLWEIPDDYDDYWYFRAFYRPELPLLTRLQYLDFHTYLPDDILTKVDRVSMAVGLECRVPFLARDVVEFSFSLPESVRYADGRLKGVLKAAYQSVLPKEVLSRSKKGFSIPSHKWKKLGGGAKRTKQESVLWRLFPELTGSRVGGGHSGQSAKGL